MNAIDPAGLSRRTVVKGVAWTVPVLTLAVATPAVAASADPTPPIAFQDVAMTSPPSLVRDGSAVYPWGTTVEARISFANYSSADVPPGAVFRITMPDPGPGGSWDSLAVANDDGSAFGFDQQTSSDNRTITITTTEIIPVQSYWWFTTSAASSAPDSVDPDYVLGHISATASVPGSDTVAVVLPDFYLANAHVNIGIASFTGPDRNVPGAAAYLGVNGTTPIYSSSGKLFFPIVLRNDSADDLAEQSVMKLTIPAPLNIHFDDLGVDGAEVGQSWESSGGSSIVTMPIFTTIPAGSTLTLNVWLSVSPDPYWSTASARVVPGLSVVYFAAGASDDDGSNNSATSPRFWIKNAS